MILKSRTLILVLLSSGLVCAQSGGRESLAEGPSGASREQSVAMYETAVEMVSQLHDPKLLASTYYHLGAAYWTAHKIEKAIGAYEKSRENFERAGLLRDLTYVLADLGVLYLNQEDYQKARNYSERSIRVADSVKTSNVPASTGPEDFGRARALQTLAEIDLRELAKGSRDTTANILNSIGYLYMEQEDYAQAKINFDTSLEIHLGEKNQVEAAKVYLNLGVIEQRQAHYDEALAQFNLSMNAAKAAQITDVQVAAGEGIGVVLTAKKNFEGALEAFNRSLTIAKETKNKTRQTELLWRSAQAYYEMGAYGQSASLANSAVELARASHLPKLTYLATTTLGESYAAQKKYDLAIETLTQAVSQLEVLREQVAGSDIETQLFLEDKVAPYYLLADLLIQQDKPLEALIYAERAKGRVLLDVLSEGRSHLTEVLTPGEKERRQRLNRNISDVNEEIRKAEVNKSATLDSLYLRLDTARLEAQSFQDALFVAHPKTRIRSGHTDMLDRLGIESPALDGDCAYLEYVVSKDHVYLFVLTKDKSTDKLKLNFYPLSATPNELAQKVDRFHDRLANQHPDYQDDALSLYSLLIAPAADHLKGVDTLCIIPDGFLWNLPFQALMPSSDRFLLDDHAISYVPSLSVLREMNKKGRGRNANSLIAFGNPVIAKDEQRQVDLCPLPEAENEVGSIANTAGLEARRVLIGRDASEKTFKTLAPGFSVIHLATHGVLDNRNPLYSHLLLTRTERDAENDGLLEAREIMDMRLDADLAVLSACDTANGKIAPGEGVMGMSWAFFVAGCRAMLVSQWKVNSSSTSQLMVNFYQQSDLVRNRSGANARALRAAALQLMKDDRYRHPFFWAGFVLVGANQTQ